MIHGIDTGYLVAAAVAEHPDHAAIKAQLRQIVSMGERLALAPQVLAEFIHVVTDSRRFLHPLDVGTARKFAQQWWAAAEVNQTYLDGDAVMQFFHWHEKYCLGRKRLLDTLLAATYWRAGVLSILTTNPNDFAIFGVFTCPGPSRHDSIPAD